MRKLLFVGQLQHLMLLLLLVPGLVQLAGVPLQGNFWLLAMVVVVVVHQMLVAVVFRTQLAFSLFTKVFRSLDLIVWGLLFIPLLMLRAVTMIGLGRVTSGSLAEFLPGVPPAAGLVVGAILAAPALYALYSVFRYFGLARALGADHFREKYRHMPLERRGIFRFSSNGMYTYVFLLFWSIALISWSREALAAALFQHAYIWVHWFCTEKPDMEAIYGAASTSDAAESADSISSAQ